MPQRDLMPAHLADQVARVTRFVVETNKEVKLVTLRFYAGKKMTIKLFVLSRITGNVTATVTSPTQTATSL